MADVKRGKCENLQLPRTLLDSLNEMRNTREHCDVFLQVNNEVFPAHRAVLAASSSYFRAMFSSQTSFTEANNSEVCLKGVEQEAVRVVLDYIYTGELEFTHLNIENVITLANLWDIPFLLSSSEDFLRDELNVSNCLTVHLLVENHQTFSSSFQDFLEKFIFNNFMDISHQQNFLSLTADRLIEILKNDLLRVKFEQMVFEAVMRWINYDRCSRKHFAAQLFKEVRFGLMPHSFLNDRVLTEDLVQQDSNCKDIVLRALKQTGLSQDLDTSCRKRKVEALYFFGGLLNNMGKWGKGKVFLPQYLDCVMGTTNLENFPSIHMTDCHVASIGEFIYFNIVDTNKVTKLNKLTMEASRVFIFKGDGNDRVNSVNSKSCAFQHFMYVVGGSCYRRFNTATSQWEKLPPPEYLHYRPGVCTLDNKVYVIGGCTKCYEECVDIVECFDVVRKVWKKLSPMPTGRWGGGATVMNHKIYVAGGELI